MSGPSSIVLNDGFAKFRRGRLRKSGTRGKGRVTIEVKTEPLVHVFDEAALGLKPAAAIREILIDSIRSIAANAAPATIKHRDKAVRAFQRGTRWATRRYSGGRTGATPPQQGEKRAFNFSGRLTNLSVRLNGDTFTINTPANRFDPTQFRSLGRLEAALEKFKSLVPELDPRRLVSNPKFLRAVSETRDDMIQKARNELERKRAELRAARLRAGGALARALMDLAA